MALASYRRTANLRLSVERVIGTSLAVTTISGNPPVVRVITVPVYLNYQWTDSENLGNPPVDPSQAWVALTHISDGAGRGRPSIVQLDCYVRTGSYDSADSDPFGITAADIADHIESLFTGTDPADNRRQRWGIPVFDFSVTPLVPTLVENACILIQNTGVPGGFGISLARTVINDDPTYQRVMIRFSYRLKRDGITGFTYRENL
mgnify:CR=1 FL=1